MGVAMILSMTVRMMGSLTVSMSLGGFYRSRKVVDELDVHWK